ncbi:MAG TPA: cation diffusion facilitator family transporter [Caulobacteraceae bacterium]|nr:cation diffusion facilitator family transporter [Caulobacteraceae bacterium]
MSGHAHAHHHGHGHGHAPGHHHHHAPPADGDWRYAVGIGLNLAFVAVEFGFGLWSRSTALMADAGHNLSDVLGLALAGGAAWLARRAGSERRTYGWGKATILAALVNAVVLVFACGAIALEAVHRFLDPQPVASGVVMGVAAAGFVINLGTALLFFRGRHDDLNARGAFLHMAADAGVSLGVVAAGVLIWFTGFSWIDPLASLAIVAVVLLGAWGLLKESADLAMDAAPPRIDMAELNAFLRSLPGVSAAHDVHVWSLSTTETALTAHLVREQPGDDAFLADALEQLRRRYRIDHATLQIERSAQDACPHC